MSAQEPVRIQCPHCGEEIEIVADPSVAEQKYVEDCEVCCRPILIRAVFDEDGGLRVFAAPENE